MNQEDTTVSVSDDNTAKISGPGARLRLIRESRHISLEEVAKYLRLSEQRVSYIEADDYEAMGAGAFAKGYLRGYARFLKVPEDEILHAFEHHGLELSIKSKKPQWLNEKITPVSSSSNSKTNRSLGFLIVLVLIGFIVYWLHDHPLLTKNALGLDKNPSADITTTTSTQTMVPIQISTPNAAVTNAKDATISTVPAADNTAPVDDETLKTKSTKNKNRKSDNTD